MAVFYEFIYMLKNIGVVDIILPFALVFTIVFAILNKTRILGTVPGKNNKVYPKTNLNMMVALVMGFSVIFPHFMGMYPVNRDPVILINSSLASVSVVLIATVMVLIVVGALFGGRTIEADSDFKIHKIVLWLGALIIVYIFAVNLGWMPLYIHMSRTAMFTAVALIMFGLIIWFVVKPPNKDRRKFKDSEYQPVLLLGGKDDAGVRKRIKDLRK